VSTLQTFANYCTMWPPQIHASNPPFMRSHQSNPSVSWAVIVPSKTFFLVYTATV